MKFLSYQILSFFVIASTLTADNFSLNFDGQNDYVDLGQNLLSGTGDFSISLWAISTSSSSDQILIQKRDVNGFNGEYLLLFQSNGKIKIWTYRNGYQWTVVSPETYNDGQWHHIVALQDNSINGGRLYVDGIEVGSSSSGVVNLMGPLRTYLGADMRDFNRYLNGFLDNVMIYSDVLTIDEIELLYNNVNTINDNIVGYWNCNAGSGDILYDQSGNANNGTINGALWSTNTAAKRIYVSTLGSDENGDGSEENPFASIQVGIDATTGGDTVLVSAGTYVENINFNGKNIKIIGESKENTIIDGNQNGYVILFNSGEGRNSLLSNFSIINGFAGGPLHSEGGKYDGGGIYIEESNPTLSSLNINNNYASDYGGGIYVLKGGPYITNVILQNNTSSIGSAIYFYDNGDLSSILENSLISNNNATGGSSLYCSSENLFFNNITVSDNYGGCTGGGLGVNASNISVLNSILWNNLSGSNSDGCFDDEIQLITGSITLTYSNIQDGWEGQGNIDNDPLFVDPFGSDYRISNYSPSIGAGTSDGAPTSDIDGNPRPNPIGTNPDMGAYENSSGTPETIIYGDVTMNGTVSSFDASLILRHAVGLDTLSYLQEFFGDVSQNNELSSLDASYILQYVVGLIDELPYTPDYVLADGEFIMEDMNASIGQTIHIPIKIINDSNISSFSGILRYNPVILSLDTITTGNYFSNSILISNKNDEGQVYVALSGFDPNDGSDELAKAIFTVLSEFNNHTTVTLTDLELNENDAIETVASTRINSTLNIDQQLPTNYTLHQNYPNPFNPSTEIRYYLENKEFVKIAIFDVIGNSIKSLVNKRKFSGYHAIQWDGTNTAGELVSGGMYFYSIEAGSFKQTKKMVLLK